MQANEHLQIQLQLTTKIKYVAYILMPGLWILYVPWYATENLWFQKQSPDQKSLIHSSIELMFAVIADH